MSRELLKGIRVIDFTDFLAGPYATMMLGDMGADVIKIENLKGGGNFTRNAKPIEKNTGRSMYWGNLNRNKRDVAVDLKSEGGKKLFAELVKSADVLVENNRPGVMAKLGFSYEVCKELNPRLIYASISGYGQTGRNSYKPGYDIIAQALGGCMSVTGLVDGEPLRAGLAVGDMFAALNTITAVCASLYERQTSGLGNYIDVALVDSIFSAMEAKMMTYVYTGVSPKATGSRYLTSAPYDCYRAGDDFFVIASGTDKHFVLLSGAIGMPELATDPRFCNTEMRNRHWKELKDIINEWASHMTAKEAVAIIDAVGVPAAEIYNCEKAANDPAIVEDRQMLVKVPAHKDHPESGDLTVIGNPIKMKEAPCQYKSAAPDFGEHNREIFKELGFTDEQLDAFKAEGVIN